MAAGGGAHQRERHQLLRRHTVHIVLRDPEIRREEVTQHRPAERERERQTVREETERETERRQRGVRETERRQTDRQ